MLEYISFLLNWFKSRKNLTVIDIALIEAERCLLFKFDNPPEEYLDNGWYFPAASEVETWQDLLEWAKKESQDA